jgi:hypothetical protein
VERSSDPNDGRQVIFRLTAEGRRVRVDASATKRRWLTNCNSCHTDGRGTTLTKCSAANRPCPIDGATPDNSTTAGVRPLFSCFGSADEGLPFNPRIAY